MGDILYDRIRDVVVGTMLTSDNPAKEIADLVAAMLNDYDDAMAKLKGEVLAAVNRLKEARSVSN